MAGRKPGTPKTGGRAKGTPNKIGAQVREMLLQALDKKGGVDYLMEVAGTHPAAFLSLVGRVLPTQLEGAGEEGEHTFTVTWLK